jgi:hypothetical protein
VPSCFFGKRNAALDGKAQALAKEHGVKSILKVAVGWVGNRKDESIPPFDKQVYSNTGISLIEAGTECEFTKPAMVVYSERSESVKVGQYVSVCTNSGYNGECKKHNGRTTRKGVARPKVSPTLRANRRIETWKKEHPMVVLTRIAKATVEAANKVKIPAPLLTQVFTTAAEEVFDHVYSDRYREIGKAFGLEPGENRNHSGRDWQGPLERFAGSALARLVLTYCAHNFGEHSASKIRAMAKIFKINVEKIVSLAEKELNVRISEESKRAQRGETRRKSAKGA